MKAHIFLTLSRSGVVKMTKEKPNLAPGQRLVRLTVEVPDSAFSAPPVLDAELTVPASALSYPAKGDAVAVEIWSEP